MAVKITDSIKQDRFVINNDDRFDIQKYDSDNAYPQRIFDIIDGSGTLSLCTRLTSKYIIGKGFKDVRLNELIIDNKNNTLYKLLGFLSRDYSKYNGFSLHLNYNALYQITRIVVAPFDFCRLGIVNKNTGEVDKIAMYDDWDRRKRKTLRKDDIKWFDTYNPNPEIIQQQVDKAGGWEFWQGQILYVSDIVDSYPKSIFHSRLKDAITENEIMTYKYASTKNGFSAPHIMFYYGEFETDYEREEFVKGINANQGGENAGNVVLIDGIPKDMKPDLDSVSSQEIDKRFEKTEETISNNLRKQFLIPPVLIGDLIAGKMGTNNETNEAISSFNENTQELRQTVSEKLSDIFYYFKTPIISDFEIEPVKTLPNGI